MEGKPTGNLPSHVGGYGGGALYYFLMEFVDGLNLRQLQGARRPTPEQALAIVPQICDALQYAHQRGIVHRDIKPENILLNREGVVKIADFGVARLVGIDAGSEGSGNRQAGGSDPRDSELTDIGKVVGTPRYMAPEQVRQPAQVDHRADIYSLGVVFYEMLTGELPADAFALPSRKVQVDVRLDEIVLRALEQEPERRYQTAEQFKTEVETIGKETIGKEANAQRSTAGAGRGLKQRLRKFLLLELPAVIAIMWLIRVFLLQPFVAATDAAAPEIPRGSRFLVWKLTHDFVPGDLIAYRTDGYVSVGRVLLGEGGVVRVNRNNATDIAVPREAILGKVISLYWRGSASQGSSRGQ